MNMNYHVSLSKCCLIKKNAKYQFKACNTIFYRVLYIQLCKPNNSLRWSD